MKIAIVGAAGRMGKMLCALAQGTELDVVSKVDVAAGYDREWAADAEGVVDFSFHAAVPPSIARAAAAGIPYLIGTTGLSDEEQNAVAEAAKAIPVVQSGNYSLGVNLLLELVKKAASVLGPEYDIEIAEMHHRHKKDAPSGTALMLAKAAAAGRGAPDAFVYGRRGEVGERPVGEIAIHALRGGDVVGDHDVTFAADGELVRLSHRATSRSCLSRGALRAARWLAAQPAGVHTIAESLGL